jgi:paraquat-inducible protein B
MKKINVVLMLAVFLFFACEEKGLNLTIRFDQIQGLQADDRVVFENNHVGQVIRVFYSNDGVYIVDLKIREDFANAATEHSRFYIIEDPQAVEKKAVEMIQLHKGGTPLANGSSVEGSTRSSAMFQNGKQFRKFFEDLSKLPESEEVKQLQKDLEELGREMEQAGKATRDKIQNDIVPMIKEELERLKKRLEKFGREEEVEPLEKQLEELTIT